MDLGCGTGSHMLEFSKRGKQVSGIDSSSQMLEVARRKFAEEDRIATFFEGDYKTHTSRQKYDLLVALFDSLGYALTDEDVGAALRNAYGLVTR
jgi:trans-aconitate methyltransferase